MCRVEVKESMEWLTNAFIGGVFGLAGLREELEHVMAERTLQMPNFMTPESADEDDQSGDDNEGSDENIDKEEDRGAFREGRGSEARGKIRDLHRT